MYHRVFLFVFLAGYVYASGQSFLHDIRMHTERGTISFEELGEAFRQWATGKDLRQLKG